MRHRHDMSWNNHETTCLDEAQRILPHARLLVVAHSKLGPLPLVMKMTDMSAGAFYCRTRSRKPSALA